jgi:hypothetical protein
VSRPFKLTAPRALEHQEQTALFRYAVIQAARGDARWSLLFAIPNGTSASSMVEAVKAKKTGRKRGVPDMFLPIPTGAYHGLFVELKRRDGKPSDLSDDQRVWLAALDAQGYQTAVAYGWEHAAAVIKTYLEGAESEKPALRGLHAPGGSG